MGTTTCVRCRKSSCPDATLTEYLTPVWTNEVTPSPLVREDAAGERREIAVGFERKVTVTHTLADRLLTWTERHLVVRSHQFAKTSEQALRVRLDKAQTELTQLNEHKQGKRRLETRTEMHEAALAILARYRSEGLVKLTITEQVNERLVRAYGERPACVRSERTLTLQSEVDESRRAGGDPPLRLARVCHEPAPGLLCPWSRLCWPIAKSSWSSTASPVSKAGRFP